MNKLVFIGNLTADPELKYASQGMAVCTFKIAVNRQFQRQDEEKKADFFRITVFGKQAENCDKWLEKGRKVGIVGRIQNNNYEKDGKTVYQDQIIADHVEFLSSSQIGARDAYQNQPEPEKQYAAIDQDIKKEEYVPSPVFAENPEDIPF